MWTVRALIYIFSEVCARRTDPVRYLPARCSNALISGARLRCATRRRAAPVRSSAARCFGALILQHSARMGCTIFRRTPLIYALVELSISRSGNNLDKYNSQLGAVLWLFLTVTQVILYPYIVPNMFTRIWPEQTLNAIISSSSGADVNVNYAYE